LSYTNAEQSSPPAVAAAYQVCKEIAKREAKNFYYSFRVLPKHKRNGMCAIYAFMRRADDISDDETQFLEERRETMADWLAAWRASTIADSDPVFVAVRDTQARFGISDDLLEQLVQGTTMDLYPDVEWEGKTPVYRDFDALYQYCYLVASVVGLVCIRIFGYSDLRAERLAEETGIAFQLTNILRDVKEDATRNRIYLPMDLMAGYGLTVERVHALAEGAAPLMPADRDMLRALGEKAEAYYGSAERLLPLIDRDSRAALWVLVTIYRGLLRRIAAADYDVFSHRASVPRAVKILVLAQGAAKAFGNRLIA
jgi:phytoene synthase